MVSTRNPSNPLSLICPLKPVGRGRLGPISSGWAGPGRGHRREWPACPCQCVQRTQGQLGYYSNKRRVIADTEMQIPISCPLAFLNTLFIIICIKLVALTGHWISMGMRPKSGLENQPHCGQPGNAYSVLSCWLNSLFELQGLCNFSMRVKPSGCIAKMEKKKKKAD